MHYHVIGIAGAGMSAIAHILLDQGHTVSGCDRQSNALTAELAARGVAVYTGHDPAHLDGVDVVAISSALAADTPELQAARERDIPLLKRADLWHEWSAAKPTLAVAGTHGKTTTTAMCAWVLQELGYDPAYIVPAGGPVPGLARFARWGSGPFVIEADEYDRLFLGLTPAVAVITSVDWDHVDVYATREQVEDAFAQFARQIRRGLVACVDDAGVRRLRQDGRLAGAPIAEYGLHPNHGWHAANIVVQADRSVFDVQYAGQQRLQASLGVPGRHNVQNALGAAAGVFELLGDDVEPAAIWEALGRFQGAARRFELKGEAGGVLVVDDYAHNPAKVRAALQAARERYPQRRVVAYFQPHTFSRTRALVDDFAASFGDAEVLLIGDIYPSRERAADFPGVDAWYLTQRILDTGAIASGDLAASAQALLRLLQPGDVLITLGAGDGYLVGEQVLAELGGGAVGFAGDKGDV